MDYQEQYNRYREYDDYHDTTNPRVYRIHWFNNTFGPWCNHARMHGGKCSAHYTLHMRPDKYKSRRKGRC